MLALQPATLLYRDDLHDLLAPRQGPCVSIYIPTTRDFAQADQNRLAFRQMLGLIEASLARGSHDYDRTILDDLRAIESDQALWKNQRDGLAVFRASEFLRAYRLLDSVPPIGIVGQSFHIKPLIRQVQDAGQFEVLCVSIDHVALLRGNRHRLEEVELRGVPDNMAHALNEVDVLDRPDSSKDVQKFHDEKKKQIRNYFRILDQAVWENHSRYSRLPIVLAALPAHQPVFRDASHNQYLLPDGIEIDPFHNGGLQVQNMLQRSWAVFEPRYQQTLRDIHEGYGTAKAHKRASDDLHEIGLAVAAGRVGTLYVEKDRHIGGRLNLSTGHVSLSDIHDPQTDDLLDDLAEWVLRRDGNVLVLPRDQMPSSTGLAALFRYAL